MESSTKRNILVNLVEKIRNMELVNGKKYIDNFVNNKREGNGTLICWII